MVFESLSGVVLALLLATALYSFGSILRRMFLHPLSGYPGPWLGKFTDIPGMAPVIQRRRTQSNHELLRRYGSCVRLGTNHLLFCARESIVDIYGQSSSPCLKDGALYGGLSVSGAVNLLNAVDREQHARLRRLASHSFSMQSLLKSEALIQEKVDEYVSVFKDGNSRVNILERTYMLMLDIVSQFSFGESLDCLNGRNAQAPADVKAFFTVIPPLSFAPFLRYLPIKSIQEGRKGVFRLDSFSRDCVASYLSRQEKHRGDVAKSKLFLERMANAVDAETGTSMTQVELVENATIFLVAGVGTTAATILYLIWECGQQHDVRRKLIEEMRREFPDPSIAPTYEKASKLKFLSYVVDETLRLRGPLNGGAPRISPGKTIAGRWVPKGVKVETNIYTTARDPEVFPSPDQFEPSRWETATPEMRQMSRPFSYGPRNCIGRHLAEVIILLTISRLYQLYDVIPDASLTPDKMQQLDLGVLEPGCDEFFVEVVPQSNLLSC
ncbi:hypothetical protein PRZ48_005512 [Zasmidium cellare]|uniref:Cytochrome P450 n=1 Tax=Zasmidium cellare TaxID=395010 RepID=A0ABR0ETT0_ZASCE|nr:hypothetical protein PRZ48_005512 [Zasmidium cellare]